ncbi:MAG: hypothetical protein NVSMB32_13210 [Actinomycetota bacterium]
MLHGVGSGGGSLFRVGAGAQSFLLNVGPVCGGANTGLGFLVVGGGVMAGLAGRAAAKLAWLVLGAGTMLLLNVARLLLLFWVGSRFGETMALKVLHPWLGITLMGAATLVLGLLAPTFGIKGAAPPSLADPPVHSATAVPARRPLTVPALAALLCAALPLGMANGALRRFDPFLSLHGSRGATPVAASLGSLDGWAASRYATVEWSKQFFGADSSWLRFSLSPAASTGPPRGPVFMDVVDTSDLEAFSRYGLEACYRFHQFRVVSSEVTDVGAPAAGQSITYVDPGAAQAWVVVSWVSPIDAGGSRRFERTALLASVALPDVPSPAQASAQVPLWAPAAARSQLIRIARRLVISNGSSAGSPAGGAVTAAGAESPGRG